MYRTDNDRIGEYLTELITKSKYKNARQFGKAYLELRDGAENVDETAISNIQNRLSQIKQGNKGIQIEDLPFFAEMLGVSIEEILSAGTVIRPANNRKTNYFIAFSDNPKEWEEYIQREDKPFLNPDEYNKTVLDYALEAGNYMFLKYLMDKKYIWFVGNDKNQYYTGFGAGTSIERRQAGMGDSLPFRMNEVGQDDLRFKMIALAIQNEGKNSFQMLNDLHAREIPLFYTNKGSMHMRLDKENIPVTDNVKRMIDSIAMADESVISYFFEQFVITSAETGQLSMFIFPWAGQLIEALIRKKRKNSFIKQCVAQAYAHNTNVQGLVKTLTGEARASLWATYDEDIAKESLNKAIWNYYDFYPNNGFVAYYTPLITMNFKGFISNVVRTDAKSTDADVYVYIDMLNRAFKSFKEPESI